MSDPTTRFSSRVENYIKYRPGYPVPILDLLKEQCGLTPSSIVADIGSGTGKLTEILLENGNTVFGVEPNAAMRAAAEKLLARYPGFKSVDGSAESTTLASTSVDIAIAAQAFHWFDPVKAKDEWVRILRPSGWAVLVFNERKLDTTPFLTDCEQLLLDFGTDYQQVRHENAISAIEAFFAPGKSLLRSFPNIQLFDEEGLKGRVFSSSYTPEPHHPNFEAMVRRIEEIFHQHAQDGHVSFEYDTEVYYGRLARTSR